MWIKLCCKVISLYTSLFPYILNLDSGEPYFSSKAMRRGAIVEVLDFRKIDTFCWLFFDLSFECAICFTPSITCWKGLSWPPFILVYRWTKVMDRGVVGAQSHHGITQLKMARAPVTWQANSTLPYSQLQSSFFSLILALALFYYIQSLSYGIFTHPNALIHPGAYIQLAFFTWVSNRYQVWSLCIVYNASGCYKSTISK
jgi:hypothetical protein